MKKIIFLLLILSPIFINNQALAQYENIERIISFDCHITINEDASMLVEENIKFMLQNKKYREVFIGNFQPSTKMNTAIMLL